MFVVSLILGLVCSKWPEWVQRNDIQLSFYIKNPKTHKAVIQGFGYLMLCLSFIALMELIVTLLS